MSGAVITPIGIQRIERRVDAIVPFLDMDDFANRQTQLRGASLDAPDREYGAYFLDTLHRKRVTWTWTTVAILACSGP